MLDHKQVMASIDEFLSMTNNILSEEQVADIRTTAISGEWLLAFETLCDNLFEQDAVLPKTAYDLLEKIGFMLDCSPATWNMLETAPKSNS